MLQVHSHVMVAQPRCLPPTSIPGPGILHLGLRMHVRTRVIQSAQHQAFVQHVNCPRRSRRTCTAASTESCMQAGASSVQCGVMHMGMALARLRTDAAASLLPCPMICR